LARVKSATTGTESTAIAATTTAPSRVVGTEFAIRVKAVTTGIVQTATAVRMTVRQPLHRPAEAGVAAAGVVAAAVEAAGAAGVVVAVAVSARRVRHAAIPASARAIPAINPQAAPATGDQT